MGVVFAATGSCSTFTASTLRIAASRHLLCRSVSGRWTMIVYDIDDLYDISLRCTTTFCRLGRFCRTAST